VNQYVFVAVRRKNPDLTKDTLARGGFVLNGGAYVVYRNQLLANDESGQGNAAYLGQSSSNITEGYLRRGAEAAIPDLWLQFLYEKFRFEAEAAMIYGSLENTNRTGGPGTDYVNPADANDPGWKIRQFGLATQTEYKALDDKLRVGFGFGYASGDDDVDSLAPQGEGLQPQRTADRTFSTFRFHPDYRVDLIMFRHILNRVQGAYYFRPSVEYDFTRDKSGQKLGGGAALVWSRADEFVQTPGHARDLGDRAELQAVLPGEGRLAQRRSGQDGRLLHPVRIRRALPALGPRLSAGPGRGGRAGRPRHARHRDGADAALVPRHHVLIG
jgi:uncharacterized protein (TIGR04551 family)